MRTIKTVKQKTVNRNTERILLQVLFQSFRWGF